jgi:hypothetical protein
MFGLGHQRRGQAENINHPRFDDGRVGVMSVSLAVALVGWARGGVPASNVVWVRFDVEATVEKLRSYMMAKKHRLKSDRSLGLLRTENHDIVHVIYLNNPPTDDPELDYLFSAIGLHPNRRISAPTPPSARRSLRTRRGVSVAGSA